MSTSGDPIPEIQTLAPARELDRPTPVFGLAVVVAAFSITFFAIIICALIASAVAAQLAAFRGMAMAQILQDPRALVPAQAAAYLVTVLFLWRVFRTHFRIPFAEAVSWRWPLHPLAYLLGGILLAVVVELISRFFPTPHNLPIEQMIRTHTGAWFMAIFGVFFAPAAEELLFRGLLFPALARRIGAVFSLFATALVFGLVHSQQLGGAWVQVGLIVFVGFVLTYVRYRAGSLSASILVHMGYNGALFSALYSATRGFTHFGPAAPIR